MKKLTILIIPLIMIIGLGEGLTSAQMEFKMLWESSQLSKVPIEIITAVDLNGDGTKEVLFNDFSYFSAIQREAIGYSPFDLQYHFWIWEWSVKEMKQKWKREFPPTIKHEDKHYFLINRVRWLNIWEIGGHKIVEAIPPYFQIQWVNGVYQWREQYGGNQDPTTVVGSWVFPFQSSHCYADFVFQKTSYPYECVVGIRRFEPSRELKIVTIIYNAPIKEHGKLSKQLRVRKFVKGFPIEWEGSPDGIFITALDPFNERVSIGLQSIGYRIFNFRPKPDGKGYELKPLKLDRKFWTNDDEYWDTIFTENAKAGMTQKKGLWEYWGYRRVVAKDGGWQTHLRRVYLNKDQTELLIDDIFFPTHDKYLGIGSFTVADLDNDGIDEVIFIEETGKRTVYHEDIEYTDTADYVRVLKWDGKAYRSVWVSPALKKRGSKVLVDDVMGNGKKQIVIGTGHGTIQIWERILK